MHGFPVDFTPEVFIDRRLSAVTYAENLIALQFDGGLTVTVLGTVSYRATGVRDDQDAPPVASSSLPSLVGRVVEAARVERSRTLMLELEGGGSISARTDFLPSPDSGL